MNRFFTKSLALVALVGAFTMFASPAQAALSMQLNAYNSANVLLATTGVINDNGAGDAAGAQLGQIVFVGGVGNWQINVDNGQGDPLLLNQPHMDLTYSSTSNAGAVGDYLEIVFTQTNTMTSSPSLGLRLRRHEQRDICAGLGAH